MKFSLLAAALLLAAPGYHASAQRAPLTAPLTPDRSVAAPVDSAAVLHQLFRHNRHLGLLGLVASSGIGNGINALNDSREWRQVVGGIALGANTGLLALVVVNRIKFSRRREREAIEQLRQHQSLRPYVQHEFAAAFVRGATRHR